MQREGAAMHPKSVCGVVSHQSLKRYVKPSEKVAGTYVLDQDAIRKAKQLVGVRFYHSTKLDWDGVAMWNGYQMLQQVEANHREYKGPLLLQPCYHRSERRIEAHVMLTILAVNCVRHLERRTGKRMNELRELFSHLNAVELADARRRCWQRTDLNSEQEEVLKSLGIPLPALQWTQWIDSHVTKKKKR